MARRAGNKQGDDMSNHRGDFLSMNRRRLLGRSALLGGAAMALQLPAMKAALAFDSFEEGPVVDTTEGKVKGLIDESTQRVTVGSEQAARAGATMQEIVDSVRRVTDIMGEISTASVEQSAGLVQINQAIGQMDGVTQQNAALVHDLGQTVRTMSLEAENLGEAIGVLNTGLKKEGRPASLDGRSGRANVRAESMRTSAATNEPSAAPHVEHARRQAIGNS